MARPVGSKNKKTEEIEKLQQRVYELEKQHNSYDDVISAFTDGYILELTENIKTISLDTLQMWFNNPDTYIEQISNLLTYYYIIDGNIFQLYDLIFSLPDLKYSIKAFKKTETYKEDIATIQYFLEREIKHKELTRDLLVQLAHDGTLLGTWLGDKNNPYFYTFDNLQYIYPYGRYRGKMVGVIDLKWIDNLKSDEEREAVFNNLKPLVTRYKYEKWKNNSDTVKKKQLQYITLPIEKSLVARTHTVSRNQRLGVPHGTQSLFDMNHKQKMKELERSMADKIIRSIAVLKFKGKDDNDIKVPEKKKKEVFAKVKKALETNTSNRNALTVIGLPDFSSFEYPDVKNGDKVLNPEKYESIDFDIAHANGTSPVLTTGQKGNFASAKLNLDTLYRKIGVMLEIIEEIYNQLIVIVLGEEKGKYYLFEYNKDTPLEKSKRIDVLKGLQSQGFSTKYLLNELGINSEEYFEESVYEIEELKLRNRIIPPLTSYTLSGRDDLDIDGEALKKPINDNPNNDNTIISKENDGNNTPKANV